ncbi:MAG: hypothetical protein J4215_04330 [Candidatus Diapherotrites archaeon]|uniref:Uncharacterized protein n=1 Tax=Candidatus Iainarchaeum sp. TaxID=3101447 RepID=A0A8T4LAP6_9ARCH|nr:hypothetical protein [Candidatus Diapherotrites archaeon]
MGLKRVGKKPLSRVREGIFQTVDIGSGFGEYISRQAERFPHRRYAVVDPRYARTSGFGQIHLESEFKRLGIHMHPGTGASFFEEMARRGWKTHAINFDMPLGSEAELSRILDLAPHTLFPNGKIFVATERLTALDHFIKIAREKGFSVTERKSMPPAQARQRTAYSHRHSNNPQRPIRRLEITFGLKKAFPDKKQRQKR